MEKKETNVIGNYYNLLQPFNSLDEANEAIYNFYFEVGVIRKKFKIPDVLITIQGSTKHEDGRVGEFMKVISYGSQLNHVPMAAYTYGETQADYRELINKFSNGEHNNEIYKP